MRNSYIRYKVEAWDSLQHLFKVKKINDHTLHFLAAFESKLDYSRLKKSIAVSAEAFPLLKCRFNENGRRPYWENCSFTADEILTLIETEDVDNAVKRFLVSEVDAFTGPQIKLGVIRNTKADTLVILMNHMLCDAAGYKDYLYLLSSIYNNIGKNANFHPPVSGSRRLSQINQMFSLKDRMKILFSKNDMSAHDPARFQLEGDLNNPLIEIRSIPEDVFLGLKEYAKRHNATINDMILTAYIRTLYKTFGYVFAIPSTVDLRKYLPGHKAEGICNLCTNLTCGIGSDIGITFEETLLKVRDSMNKEKSSISCLKSISMLEKVFDVLPYKLAESIVKKSFKNAPIAFTNIGIIEKNRFYFDKLKIKNAYMTGSVKYSPYFQLAVSTFDNKPVLSVNLFGSETDRNNISAFLDQVVLELYGV
ncbi:hypothetical protein DS742_01575 [Lacrimispora amygdalina]|uniref:Condensation domain-containing protein n=1 Tax=Lacrimispora amygdalina TaxID=253257 RepID=A0A3E2NIE3_9FIRM|nr:hypothetical protein [Clostridium indicum]RFZ80691.1 hypothetical protein DS742_01575 [Clostridium indicum]